MKNDAIIGYYDYYYDEYEYSHIGEGHGTLRVDKKPNDVQKFFYSDRVCPFCSTELKKVFLGYNSSPRGGDIFEKGQVLECPNCNWWTYKLRFLEDTDLVDSVKAYYSDARYYGITKSYNVSDKMLPIEVLATELRKKPDILYDVNPYRLEKLSQEILKGVYECDVHHVGKTGDGGTDLVVLESDEPILVQVKRRENPNHVELVKGVREFVGTLFIENKRKGIYISTAKSFSKGAKEVAEKLLDNRQLDYFELVDYDKLCSLVSYVQDKKPWRDLVEYFYAKGDADVYDTEEAIKKREQEAVAFWDEFKDYI